MWVYFFIVWVKNVVDIIEEFLGGFFKFGDNWFKFKVIYVIEVEGMKDVVKLDCMWMKIVLIKRLSLVL